MSLEHKDVVRMNDEYSCKVCGKTWAVDDKDPPECSPTARKGVSRPHLSSGLPMHRIIPRSNRVQEEVNRIREKVVGNAPLVAQAYDELENRVLAHVASGAWPTPPTGILQAFIVNDETMQRALLVYAPDKNSARRYIEAMTKRADLEIRRIGAMDQYARGLSCYCEANPLTLRIAKNTSRVNVVSPASWRL